MLKSAVERVAKFLVPSAFVEHAGICLNRKGERWIIDVEEAT